MSFLRLPLELRDEIYSYLLLFDISTEGIRETLPRLASPSLDVSILRVNHQIHDEAIRVLYSCNAFPIRIQIGGSYPLNEFGSAESWYNVNYETLWEVVGYIRTLDRWSMHVKRQLVEYPCDAVFSKTISDQQPRLLPAPRYRHLLRRFNIYLVIPCLRNWDWSDHGDCSRETLKSILKPFRHRLGDLATNAGDKLFLNITVSANPGPPGPGALRAGYDDVFQALKESKAGAHMRFLRELAYVVWPLTNGKWGFDIKLLDQGRYSRFHELKHEAWLACDEDHDDLGSTEEEFFESSLNIRVSDRRKVYPADVVKEKKNKSLVQFFQWHRIANFSFDTQVEGSEELRSGSIYRYWISA